MNAGHGNDVASSTRLPVSSCQWLAERAASVGRAGIPGGQGDDGGRASLFLREAMSVGAHEQSW